MSTMFYRAFEDRHRGSRELITQRLQVYLPFVTPLQALYEQCPVMDLGCGRGEWLELLQSLGFMAKGVDLDEGMLEACRSIELSAEYGDALSALAELEDESQVIVSAFHLVEHIPFADVQTLVREALRVLKPAGLLILETPNAENLIVGTNNFFLDPTHEKPIPHALLSFLTEYSGFARTKVVRLQENTALHEDRELTLMDVLGGASPDYAIIAQKAADTEHLEAFAPGFERHYGLSLEDLADRYDHQLKKRTQDMLDNLELPALHAQLVEITEELQRTRQCEESLQAELQLTRRCEEVLQVELQHTRECEEALQTELQHTRYTEESLQHELQHARRSEEALYSELGAARRQRDEALQAELQQARQQRDEALQAELQFTRGQLEKALNAELIGQRQVDEALRNELQLAIAERDEALAKAHEFWLQSCAEHSRAQMLTNSLSWRATAPLRWVMRTVRALPGTALRALKSVPRRLLGRMVRFILGRPALLRVLQAGLRRVPRLHGALKRLAYNRGLLGNSQIEVPNSDVPQHLSGLSAQARQVYQDLKKAIDQKDLR